MAQMVHDEQDIQPNAIEGEEHKDLGDKLIKPDVDTNKRISERFS
jgi:hypothetical protein